MKITYETKAIANYFTNFGLMMKKIGKEKTKAAKKRYDQLRAASNFYQYLSIGLGKPHLLRGDHEGHYAVSITGNYRLILRPDTQSLDPASLKMCDVVIIKGVVDYHGGKNKWLIP